MSALGDELNGEGGREGGGRGSPTTTEAALLVRGSLHYEVRRMGERKGEGGKEGRRVEYENKLFLHGWLASCLVTLTFPPRLSLVPHSVLVSCWNFLVDFGMIL